MTQLQSGKEILKILESENKYVFHGSDNPHLEILEPRQAYNSENGRQIDDDKPGVHASQFSDIAIFMGIINKQNCPDGFDSGFSYKEGGGVTFSASQKSIDQLDDQSRGYVYVFAKEDFVPRGRVQLISYQEVKPLQMVEVTKDDLPKNIVIKDN